MLSAARLPTVSEPASRVTSETRSFMLDTCAVRIGDQPHAPAGFDGGSEVIDEGLPCHLVDREAGASPSSHLAPIPSFSLGEMRWPDRWPSVCDRIHSHHFISGGAPNRLD
jgi:hypothetical protein